MKLLPYFYVHLTYWPYIILFVFRLLGTATVPLKDLVKDSSHTMQADVNLLDGNNRMTQVCELVLIIIIDLFNSKCAQNIFYQHKFNFV